MQQFNALTPIALAAMFDCRHAHSISIDKLGGVRMGGQYSLGDIIHGGTLFTPTPSSDVTGDYKVM